jgi:hypothetical protein
MSIAQVHCLGREGSSHQVICKANRGFCPKFKEHAPTGRTGHEVYGTNFFGEVGSL